MEWSLRREARRPTDAEARHVEQEQDQRFNFMRQSECRSTSDETISRSESEKQRRTIKAALR
eukprot:2221406-Pleurochrysis_carterae.AAC.1